MRYTHRAIAIAIAAAAAILSGCVMEVPRSNAPTPVVELPAPLLGNAELLPETSAEYASASPEMAQGAPYHGGISDVLVVRIRHDVDVYRAWSGPDVKSPAGYTNRIGAWWALSAPSGTREEYRHDYAICGPNTLTWVTHCRLKPGSVVAVGPGQSMTCADSGRTYPANPRAWQVYIADVRGRGADDLDCSAADADYPDSESDMARHATQ